MLHIEIQQSVFRGVRPYYVCLERRGLQRCGQFIPIFPAALLRSAAGERKPSPRDRRILRTARMQNQIGHVLRREREQLLAVAIGRSIHQANRIQVNADEFVGVVAKINVNGGDPGVYWSFFLEFLLVGRRVHPGIRGNQQAVVGIPRGKGRGVFLSCGWRDDKHKQGSEEKPSRRIPHDGPIIPSFVSCCPNCSIH